MIYKKKKFLYKLTIVITYKKVKINKILRVIKNLIIII